MIRNNYLRAVVLLTLAAIPVFRVSAAWYRGNTHSHTQNSDGSGTPVTMSQQYKNAGYAWNTITDHSPYASAVIYENLSDPAFLAIGGSELSETTNVCGIGISQVFHVSSFQGEIDAINGNGGIPIIAHPSRSGLNASKILATTGVRHMEVYNGEQPMPDKDVPIWDGVLSTGRVMFAVAADDDHDPSRQLGKGWSMVRADALTKQNILAAFKAGDYYASTGITLSDYQVDRASRTITVTSQNGTSVSFVGKNGQVLKTVTGSQGSYTFTGSELYVRAEVSDGTGKKAWAQPVFLSDFSGPTVPPNRTPTPTIPSGKAGDANGDNKVDGLDYVVWLNHFGQSTLLGAAGGDFNRSGTVDGQDYVVWLNAYGT